MKVLLTLRYSPDVRSHLPFDQPSIVEADRADPRGEGHVLMELEQREVVVQGTLGVVGVGYPLHDLAHPVISSVFQIPAEREDLQASDPSPRRWTSDKTIIQSIRKDSRANILIVKGNLQALEFCTAGSTQDKLGGNYGPTAFPNQIRWMSVTYYGLAKKN